MPEVLPKIEIFYGFQTLYRNINERLDMKKIRAIFQAISTVSRHDDIVAAAASFGAIIED